MIAFGDIEKNYYLRIISDALQDQILTQFTKNEMIDDITNNYTFIIAIHLSPCPKGYIFLEENSSSSYFNFLTCLMH